MFTRSARDESPKPRPELEHQKKAKTDQKREKTYTVTSSGEIINVNCHRAIIGLVAIPLGRHVGLAAVSWLGGCFGEGAGRKGEKKKKKKKKSVVGFRGGPPLNNR